MVFEFAGGVIASIVVYLERKKLKKKLAAAEADVLAQAARVSPAVAAAVEAAVTSFRPKVHAAIEAAKTAIVADTKAAVVDAEAFVARIKVEVEKVF